MKKSIFILSLLAIVIAVPPPIAGAEKAKNGVQGSRQQEQAEKNMEERLRKLGKDLDDLKARMDAMAERARAEMNRHIAEAEKKGKVAGRELEDVKAESKKKWETFSRELNAAMDEFEKAYKKAKARLTEQGS
jgi:hypothetical protein